MKKFLLALDEGTTSCRAVLFSLHDMRAVCSYSEPLNVSYPFDGWVEQNAAEIYEKQMRCVRRIFETASYDPACVIAVGITNQRESTVIWDRKTGAREKAERGELLAGTLDSYLVYRMTGGARHITDVTNASRTMLFDINTLDWDDELLSMFRIPRKILPEVTECTGNFGSAFVAGRSMPICGIAGDQQAALVGQACFDKGDVKCTYGTGAFILANIGSEPRITRSPLLTTVAYKIKGETAYAFEGSVFNAGSVMSWLESVGLLSSAGESEAVASGVPDSGGVYLIPAFTGMGAPYWNMNCRAAVLGITRATTRAHIVRAALECIALRSSEVYDLMTDALGMPLGALNADGGMSRNSLLLSAQADIIGNVVRKSCEVECTALGAAYLAGIGAGVIKGTGEIKRTHACEATFEPSSDGLKVERLKAGWKQAVGTLLTDTLN